MESQIIYQEPGMTMGQSILLYVDQWLRINRLTTFPKIHALVPLTFNGTLPAAGRGVMLEVTSVEILFG